MTATIPRTAYTYVPATGVTPDLTNHQIAHAGVMQDIDDTLAAVTNILQGGIFFNVKAYGALGNDSHNDRAAIVAADAAAAAVGGYVLFPPGTYLFTAQITQTAPWIGVGMDFSVLHCNAALGSGVPAVIMAVGMPVFSTAMRDLTITGPGARTVGVKTAICDGLRIDAPHNINDVKIQSFDSGFVWNSNGGHVSMFRCISTNNYYGIYDKADNGDNFVLDSIINGNSFANFAIPYVVNNPANLTATRCHWGFAPYGFYQEASGTSASAFMASVTLTSVRFEAIGNGVIFSEQAQYASPGSAHGQVTDLEVNDPGHSWAFTDPNYNIAGRAHDWAIVVGALSGRWNLRSSQFAAGAVGTTRCNYTAGLLEILAGKGIVSDVTVTSGVNNHEVIYKPFNAYALQGTGTIASGQTNVTITTPDWVGPIDSIQPIVTATSTGGLSSFALYVDTIAQSLTANSGAGSGSFVVHVTGGTPSTDLTFNWRIR